MDFKEEIQDLLKEVVVDFDDIGPEHLGGFCTYNPKISKYALENKDQLAETIIFVIATQQTDWPTVVAQFKHMIYKLRADNTLYDKDGKYSKGSGFYKLIGFMGKNKINAIDAVWNNRGEIYSTTKSILKKWSYNESSEEAEQAIFNLFRYFMSLPQLSYAKAGFAIQLVTGRLGCYDSVNTAIYPIPDEFKKVLVGKGGKFRPNTGTEKLKTKRMMAYIQFLETLKDNANSPHNQELWDRWTHVIAQKIKLAGKTEPITVKKGGEEVDLQSYKTLALSNPDIKAYMDKWQDKITGDVVSKQHYLPNIVDDDVNRLDEKLMLKDWGTYIGLVAEAYENAPDYDSSVVPLWNKLNQSNYVLWKRLLSKVNVVFTTEDKSKVGKINILGRDYPIKFLNGEPYSSQQEMKSDFEKTGNLKISIDYSNHPVFNTKDNIVFRTVHDYIVHILGNHDFSGKGEIASYNLHVKLAPNDVAPAIFTEVVGQASYFLTKGNFPKQKIAILDGFDFHKVGVIDNDNYEIVDKELVKKSEIEQPELQVATYIPEAEFGGHSLDRIKQRLDALTDDIPAINQEQIRTNLDTIERTNFPKNKSFAIMLGHFRPNPNSEYYYETPDGRGYYQVIGDEVLSDSTGNQFWLVIRGNKVTTFMLRKSIQTKDLDRNSIKMRTDYSIKNINNFLKKAARKGGKRK